MDQVFHPKLLTLYVVQANLVLIPCIALSLSNVQGIAVLPRSV